MEQNIYVLHETLKEYIRDNIFSNSLINKFSHQFKRLLNFMDDNSFQTYDEEIGKKYLAYRALSGNNRRKNESSPNNERRYITLLNGMITGQWIKKISKKDYNMSFPGSFGEYVMNFLKKYVETRRLNIDFHVF